MVFWEISQLVSEQTELAYTAKTGILGLLLEGRKVNTQGQAYRYMAVQPRKSLESIR